LDATVLDQDAIVALMIDMRTRLFSWMGRDWFEVQREDDVRLKDDENPTALNLRGENHRAWVMRSLAQR